MNKKIRLLSLIAALAVASTVATPFALADETKEIVDEVAVEEVAEAPAEEAEKAPEEDEETVAVDDTKAPEEEAEEVPANSVIAEAPADDILIAPKATKNPFTETYGKWYEEYVDFVYEYGFMIGFEDGKFHADDMVTTAQLTQIMYNILFSNPEVPAEGEAWYAPVQKWGEANKIFDGIGEFEANHQLTREEAMTLIYNAYKVAHEGETADLTAEADLSVYSDSVELNDNAKEAAKWNIQNGIITGDDQIKLNPRDCITRAETAAIIQRFVKKMIMVDPIVGIPNPMVKYESIAEAEAKTGLKFPEINVEGFKADEIYTYNEEDELNAFIEVKGKMNGKEIVIRTGKGDRAISGIYSDDVLEDAPLGVSVAYKSYKGEDDKSYAFAEWSKTDENDNITCYSVAVEDGTVGDVQAFVQEIGAEALVPATAE